MLDRFSDDDSSIFIIEVDSLIHRCSMLAMTCAESPCSRLNAPVRLPINPVHNKCCGAECAAICKTMSVLNVELHSGGQSLGSSQCLPPIAVLAKCGYRLYLQHRSMVEVVGYATGKKYSILDMHLHD